MRIFAVHDAEGAISEFVTSPDDGPVAGIVPRSGMVITEIAVPDDIALTQDLEATAEEFEAIARQYRVKVEPRMASLELATNLNRDRRE
jgi:hypothetical protein